MADLRTSQFRLRVASGSSPDLRTSQSRVRTVFNYPALEGRASQSLVRSVTGGLPEGRVSQTLVRAVVKGKVYDPSLKAWTFDLDGHEFYVLNLGEGKTLVYDLTTGQWAWWSSDPNVYWRASIGTNWTSSGDIPYYEGSNVIVGDNTFGILWILDPEQGYDDSLIERNRTQGIFKTFTRVATGQLSLRGRLTVPCYQLYLTADRGEPIDSNQTVTLSYSDDGGHTFIDASDPVLVESGNYYQEFAWRSLGLIRAPGRLFRIEDTGAFAQIDELNMYEGNN